MLLRFRVLNYRSLRSEQEFSLVAAPLKGNPNALVRVDDEVSALRVAAIYGANASGKSNVLLAMRFMEQAVRKSQKDWSPTKGIKLTPFILDRSEPSRFEMDVLVEGVPYQYGFELNSERFTREWLFAYPKNRKQEWFVRTEQQFAFGKSFKGGKETVAAFTRPNSLFLSAAAQNNHESLMPLYRWFVEEFDYVIGSRQTLSFRAANLVRGDSQAKEQIERLLSKADLGLCELSVTDKKMEQKEIEVVKALARAISSSDTDAPNFDDFDATVPEVTFRHTLQCGEAFTLELIRESEGTQTFFGLLGKILKTLRKGGVLLIDELDASLHPLLSLKIVELFNAPDTNPKGAQLVFTTHDTTLLRESELRRDQLWFTEKDENGGTQLYPLTDFNARDEENLERGYLQGRYGAIPILGDFAAALKGGL